MRTIQPHSGTVASAPGSHYHEMNKTIFISGFLGLLEDHNMKFSDDILDSTDFVPKVFELLQNYGIHPPTENVPKFLVRKNIVSSSGQGREVKSIAKKPAKDEDEEEEEKKIVVSEQADKVVPKSIANSKPKEDHEVEEKKIDSRSPGAIDEKKGGQTKGEGEDQRGEEEYEKIEEAGVTVVKLRQKTSKEENTERNDSG